MNGNGSMGDSALRTLMLKGLLTWTIVLFVRELQIHIPL